jgi:hypothetical protein
MQNMTTTIEIIEDNAGGLTIQNTATKAVAYFADKSQAIDSIKDILAGGDMSGWDTSDAEYYISDEDYNKQAPNGGYRMWDDAEAREFAQ